jgi:hypothetical protein
MNSLREIPEYTTQPSIQMSKKEKKDKLTQNLILKLLRILQDFHKEYLALR